MIQNDFNNDRNYNNYVFSYLKKHFLINHFTLSGEHIYYFPNL